MSVCIGKRTDAVSSRHRFHLPTPGTTTFHHAISERLTDTASPRGQTKRKSAGNIFGIDVQRQSVHERAMHAPRRACTNLAACRCRDVVNCSRMQGDRDEKPLICCLGRVGVR